MVNPIGGVMIETKAEYLIRLAPTAIRKRCPDCFRVFGREINGGEYLLVGNVLMDRFWGHCAVCGKQLIWNKSDRYLERAVKR